MLVLLCKVHHLRDFGLGDFISENAADTDAFLVDVQHHPRRLFGIHLEKCFQHMDDKFHRGVVVVKQQHLILAGLFRLWTCACGKTDARPNTGAAAAIIVFIVAAIIGATGYLRGILKLHRPEIGYRGGSPQEGIMR
jgi:hypothetical protein